MGNETGYSPLCQNWEPHFENQFIYRFFFVSISTFILLYPSMSFYTSISFCILLSLFLSFCLLLYPSIHLSFYHSVYYSILQSISFSILLSTTLSFCLLHYPSIYLSILLSLPFPFCLYSSISFTTILWCLSDSIFCLSISVLLFFNSVLSLYPLNTFLIVFVTDSHWKRTFREAFFANDCDKIVKFCLIEKYIWSKLGLSTS